MLDQLIQKINHLDRRYRLLICLVISLVTFWFIRKQYSFSVDFMISWITFSAAILIFSWFTMFTSHPREIRDIAREQDESRTTIFLVVVVTAFISLIAIILLMQHIPREAKKGLSRDVIISITSVLCSWTLIHTLFTLHYAHVFYKEEVSATQSNGQGLIFPEELEPDYLDFAYFSFVIGMTFQVSDVQITSRRIRRLVLIHGLLSFIFNTAIVALSINIIAGVIQK